MWFVASDYTFLCLFVLPAHYQNSDFIASWQMLNWQTTNKIKKNAISTQRSRTLAIDPWQHLFIYFLILAAFHSPDKRYRENAKKANLLSFLSLRRLTHKHTILCPACSNYRLPSFDAATSTPWHDRLTGISVPSWPLTRNSANHAEQTHNACIRPQTRELTSFITGAKARLQKQFRLS